MPVTQTQTGSYIHRHEQRKAAISEFDDPARARYVDEVLAKLRRPLRLVEPAVMEATEVRVG